MISSDFFGSNVTVPCPFADLNDLALYSLHNQLRRQLREATVFEKLEIAKRYAAIKAELIQRDCIQIADEVV